MHLAITLICKNHRHVTINPRSLAANGVIKGGIGGIALASPMQKVWRVAQALGDIAFAYPYSLMLLEIEVGQLVHA
jgi:hypothetical protein